MANSNEINEIFRELIHKHMPDKLVTNFVIVAEITDETGSQINLYVSDTMSPWLAAGMLQFAKEIVSEETEEDD